jgi:multiple sugar transport system ATP-binding protein
MADLSLNHVTKAFPGNVQAVKDFSLEIADREFIVLVGPSGCGKTTVLRMIAGLEEASGGDIRIGGRRVNDLPPKDRDIAMVFQNYALYPHMTVRENMAFGLKVKKTPKAEIEAKIQEAAAILEIAHLLDRKPRALSGGQRQRVALGRAIVRNPKVFLMDEPLSNLDAKLRVQMRTEISKLHRRLETTFVYVTHDQTEAMTMGSRIVIMRDGVVQQVDTPQNAYRHPANLFVAGFIGSPQMNLYTGTVERSGAELLLRARDGRAVLLAPEAQHRLAERGCEGREVHFGIRPENLHDAAIDPLHDDHGEVESSVEVAELMGAEVYLVMDFWGRQTTARVNAKSGKRPGDPVRLHYHKDKVYLFDKETEMTI